MVRASAPRYATVNILCRNTTLVSYTLEYFKKSKLYTSKKEAEDNNKPTHTYIYIYAVYDYGNTNIRDIMSRESKNWFKHSYRLKISIINVSKP